MEPGYADGWVNVARARIQEGNMEGAEECCARPWRSTPSWPRPTSSWAWRSKARGRYDEALDPPAHAPRAQYPRDRVVRTRSAACCS